MPLDNRLCFQVNLRDGLRCQHCKKRPENQETYHRGFEYHHILPKSQGGLDQLANIVLLCHSCHQQVHQGKLVYTRDEQVIPQQFLCKRCKTQLDTGTVRMNCGWYQCHHCQEMTHLYEHCL